MYTHIQTFVLWLFYKIINFYDRQQALQQNKFLCGPGNEKNSTFLGSFDIKLPAVILYVCV